MGFFATLAAKLTLDGTGFKSGLKDAESSVKKFGTDTLKDLKGQMASAFGTAALVAFSKSVLDHAGKIKDLSEEYGMTTRKVQEWMKAFAGNENRMNFALSKLEKLNEMRRKAGEDPIGEEAEALKKLGISAQAVNDPMFKTHELLENISDEAMESKDAAHLFFDVFGKGGERMIAVIRDLKEAKGGSNGWFLSPEEIDRFDQASKQFDAAMLRMKAHAAGPMARFAENPVQSLFNIATLGMFKPTAQSMPPDMGGDFKKVGNAKFKMPEDQEKLYENLALSEQKFRLQQAEFALADKIYQMEFRRASNLSKITMLEKTRAELLAEEAKQKLLLSKAETEEEKTRFRQNLAKLQSMRLDKEGELHDLNKAVFANRPRITETQGVISGGNANLARFYNGIGMAAGNQDTATKQVQQGQQMLQVLREAKGQLQEINRKTKPTNAKF